MADSIMRLIFSETIELFFYPRLFPLLRYYEHFIFAVKFFIWSCFFLLVAKLLYNLDGRMSVCSICMSVVLLEKLAAIRDRLYISYKNLLYHLLCQRVCHVILL